MFERARTGVYAVFILAGVAGSSVLSRIPQLKDLLELKPGPLGLLILMGAIGSLTSLPMSGLIVHRLGPRRTVAVMGVVNAVGIVLVGIGAEVNVRPTGIGFFLFGFGAGAWDVAMNVEAAAVEVGLGQSIMSRFHAAFSIGTVVGGLVGTAMNALSVPVPVHLVGVGALLVVAVPSGTRGFLPQEDLTEEEHAAKGSPLAAWKERRTLLIGLFVLTAAFAEGTGNDWLGVTTVEDYGAGKTFGSFAYVLFVSAMTTGRWFGPRLLDRFGRVKVMRSGAALSAAGVLIVVFGPAIGVAFMGMLLWGLGTSLGFPTGMSAAADDPERAAGRVSVVATIGYVAFLAGPASIGWVGNHTGVRDALLITAGMLVVGFLVAGSTRPLSVAPAPGDTTA